MLTGHRLTFFRGDALLFSDLSLTLNAGESLSVKGPNGSGKSTLLRLVAGLIPPTQGSLLWKGEDIATALPAYQNQVLYAGHRLGLHPYACVADQLSLWEKTYKIPTKRLTESLETWGLEELKNQKIATLSQGQQKRLSLSRLSWLTHPLWILDEPHAALDTDGREILSAHLKAHLKDGGMALLATHEDIPSSQEISL